MSQWRRWTMVGVGVFATMLLASACSFSTGETPPEAAVDLIEGDFAEMFDLDLVDASCVSPPDENVGTTFTCIAYHRGQRVDFEVLIDREDHINASSRNVLFPASLEAIAESVAASLNQQSDFGLTAEDLDCGTEAIILGNDRTLVCGLTDPATGDVFDTTISISDLESLVFDFEVAANPRS